MHKRMSRVTIVVAAVAGFAFLLLLFIGAQAKATSGMALALDVSRVSMNPGPDLAIEKITLDPPVPVPGQQTEITVTVKNVGTSRVEDGFFTYLYIDPAEQPPTFTTPDTSLVGWFVGLNPGASFNWSYSDVLTPTSEEYTIYAWVDRDNAVMEDDEENNLSYIMVKAVGSGELVAVPTYALGNSMVWVASVVRDAQGRLLAGREDITGTVGSTEITFVDDGSEGDFEAHDGIYGAWVEVSGGGAYSVTMYAGGAMLDSTSLMVTNDPALLVVSDFKALYAEFFDTGTSVGEDWDANGIIDYLELVARIYQYAQAHRGVVFDLPHEISQARGYTGDYATLNYGGTLSTTNRFRMARLIDELIYQVSVKTGGTAKNVAIVGDDEVVPFYRVKDPQDIYRETKSRERQYPVDLWGTLNNPALIDSEAGYILSDVPYGIKGQEPPSQVPRPHPQMGVGRIFSSTPYKLVKIIDTYEQPIIMSPTDSTASLFYSAAKPEAVDFPRLLERSGAMRDKMGDWYGSSMTAYSGATGPWKETDFAAQLLQDDLVSLWGDSTHLGVEIYTEGYTGMVKGYDLQSSDVTGPSVLLGVGCHMGYTTGHYPDGIGMPYYEDALILHLLERGVTVFAPTSFAYVTLISPQGSQYYLNLNELVTVSIFNGLQHYNTVGDAWRKAFTTYHARDPYWLNNNGETRDFYRSVHTAVAYSSILYGLPTQDVDQSKSPHGYSVDVIPASEKPLGVRQVVTEHRQLVIDIPEFRSEGDGRGGTLYSLSQGGTHVIPTNGPPLPLVVRSHLLPVDTTVVTVTQVGTPTYSTVSSVTLTTAELWTMNGEQITETRGISDPYPSQMYWWDVIPGEEGVRVVLSIVPLEYNPTTHTAKLYHHLEFDIEYIPSAVFGDEFQIDGLDLNNGQPVKIDDTDIPLVVSIESNVSSQIALSWSVHDPSGFIVDSGQEPISVVTGMTVVTLTMSSVGWNAGPLDLAVGVLESGKLQDSANEAFLAEGIRIVEHGVAEYHYPPEAMQATWQFEVRDENGMPVSGLASSVNVLLDGEPVGFRAQEIDTGVYEVRMSLVQVGCGVHVVRISVTDTRGIAAWREWEMSGGGYRAYLPSVLQGK